MKTSDQASQFSAGEAVIDPALGEIRVRGSSSHIEPRLMSVLSFLTARQGQVVTRQELLDAVWGGDEQGDESLTQAISGLRRALGDSARSPRYIQTIPKTGYRFVAVPTPARQRRARLTGPVLDRIMMRFTGRRRLYVAAVAVMVLAAGLYVVYDDPSPVDNINPNPDYEIEIEDLDFD